MNSVNIDLNRLPHSIGQNWDHVILVPKSRYPVFKWKIIKEYAEEVFDELCKEHKIEMFSKEVMSDHVHLFISCPPDYLIRKLFKILKGRSAYEIRKQFPSLRRYEHLWNRGTMYRSIGSVNSDTVKHYIEKSNSWSNTKQTTLI